MASHSRRNLRPGSTLVSLFMILSLAAVLFGAVIDSAAQQGPQLQANPTDEPEEEIDSFQANPTQEPTKEPIDDIVSNPTEEPTREPIDDVVSNPTERPTDEPIDDVVANPTEPSGIDDEAIPTTGTVRVEKRDCPLGIVETATLAEYLYLCPQEHNGVEFVVNDVNGAQAGVTAGGVVEWTGVDPGVFNITETVPAGYGDPIVFCGYTESPGGGVQHPALMDATGGIVEGTFPDAMFEFVCYWMNIKDTGQVIPGADDVAIAEGDRTATFLLFKSVCRNDIPPHQDAAYYLEHCTEFVDGIPFTVTHGNGSSTKTTTDGEAEWHGIPLGPFTVDEDLPVQFGEPIVFCGWTAIYEGIVYDAFSQQVPAPGGTVELEVTIPGATHFCYYFNVKGVGDLVDPDSVANTLLVRKWDCPDGTSKTQRDRDYYFQRCELMLEPVQFTLSNANGDDTKATQGGYVEWIDLPLGEFSLTETIPAGYGAPVWFCGWYAFWGGFHYDAFPQLVITEVYNVYEGEITIPNTDYFCEAFNIVGEIDDLQANTTEDPGIDDIQANPTDVPGIDDFQGNATAGTVRLEKHDCPLGVPTDATLADYLQICTQLHDGVEFSLETSEGVDTGTTAMGQVTWTGVSPGAFEIQETIPAGYTDPIVFCGYTESPGGGVQHPALQTSTGGVVAGTFPENTIFEFVCYWINIKSTGQVIPGADDIAIAGGGGLSSLTIRNRDCPGVSTEGDSLDVLDGSCSGDVNGATFEVTHANGSSSKPIVDGKATWEGLPLVPYTIDGVVPGGYGDPIVSCVITAFGQDDAWLLSAHELFPSAVDGVIELGFDPPDDLEIADIAYMQTTCTYYNFPLGPGSFTQPQETSNSFTARKWLCDSDTQAIADQDYLESQCELSNMPVEFTLTNADGASTQATDPGWTTWENVPLGEFTLQETIPDGYAEPIVFCDWTATYNGMVYDDFPHLVPSPGGLVEGEITIPHTSHACVFYNIATGPGVGGPDSVTANPQDESNTLVAHKWFCEEGTAADAHLLDYFEQCQLAAEPVEFTLTNDDGVAVQETAGGTAQWDDIPLGQFTLKETIPAGYEVLVVWCGWTAFYDGAVYDAFSQPKESQDGLVIGEISVPNTNYRCDFINVPVVIDDVVANPTQAPTEEPIDDVVANPTERPTEEPIDDVVANPTERPTEEPIDDVVANPTEEAIDDFQANPGATGTLIVHLWVCPPAYDPLAGDALADCTESQDGVTFDLVNHAQGEPDFQATTGDEIAGTAVFEPQPGTYSLKEQIPDGFGVPFLWQCTGLAGEPLAQPISTINFFRIVIDSGQEIECDWMNVPVQQGLAGADDFQANPTNVPEIDDVEANPTEAPDDGASTNPITVMHRTLHPRRANASPRGSSSCVPSHDSRTSHDRSRHPSP